jgi:hypothetical protein
MNIIKFQDKLPTIDPRAYISPGVYIIGDVTIGKDSNVWFGSVLRGDVAPIHIGQSTNIQDGTIIHTSRNDGPTYIGDNVTIGHRAVIHACTIQDYGFVGMSATVMDKAIVAFWIRSGWRSCGTWQSCWGQAIMERRASKVHARSDRSGGRSCQELCGVLCEAVKDVFIKKKTTVYRARVFYWSFSKKWYYFLASCFFTSSLASSALCSAARSAL